jgi:hypothetical protein
LCINADKTSLKPLRKRLFYVVFWQLFLALLVYIIGLTFYLNN